MLLDTQRKDSHVRPMLLPQGNVYSLLFKINCTVAHFLKKMSERVFLFEAVQPALTALILPSSAVSPSVSALF